MASGITEIVKPRGDPPLVKKEGLTSVECINHVPILSASLLSEHPLNRESLLIVIDAEYVYIR